MPAAPDLALSSSIAAIRARLIALAAAHADGSLDDAAYDAARRDAERALSDAVLAAPLPAAGPAAAPAAAGARPSARLVATLVVVVAVVAIGGYAFTGSPTLAGLGAPPAPAVAPPTAANGSEREIGLQQIAEMVDKLATRLKERPDDAEGWTMLARSYTVLRRYRDALPAYQRAIALQPKDASLMADYSDARAAANDGKPDAEALALIERALAIDPVQPKALALAGTIAFDRGDYAGAVARWQKIADGLPPDSEFHRQVMENIDEARRRGGMPPSASASAAAPAASASTAPTGATAATATNPPAASAVSTKDAGREALSGTVRLAPALASRVAPTDTVFVLARAPGARMPLAVQRATVADLPLRFRLDDSMAMTPAAKLSTTPRVVVVARISKSGNAISEAGDLGGETEPVAPGTSGLVIEIAKEAGPR